MLSSGPMNRKMRIITLKGPITVTYREEGGEVLARALQFDLVGVGKTRDDALKELQDLFSDYAEEVLSTGGKVRFFNPSDSEEWDNSEKQLFNVVFVLVRKGHQTDLSSVCDNIQDLHRMRKSVESIRLQPCCSA